MDLSKLSTEDLIALKNGDITKVSTEGLTALKSMQKSQQNFDPTQNMSGFKKFAAGGGKAIYDIGRGIGQMTGILSQEDIDRAKELDAPLMRTGAGMAGNVAGNIAMALPTAAIPGANTVTGSSLIGAGLSALQPTESGESRLSNAGVGAIAGGALPAVIGAGKVAKSAFYDPIAGQEKIIGSTLTRLAGDNPKALAQALKKGSSGATSGVKLPAGAISENEGLAAIEDAIRTQFPSGSLAKGAQQNRNALAEALRSVAKTPEEMQLAEQARESAANLLYGKAFESDLMRQSIAKQAKDESVGLYNAGGVPAINSNLSTKNLQNLMKRPTFKDAFNYSKEIMQDKGIPINQEKSIKIAGKAPIPINEKINVTKIDAAGMPRTKIIERKNYIPGSAGSIIKSGENGPNTLQELHYIKLALDKMKNPNAITSAERVQNAAINDISSSLDNELQNISPLYQSARKTYEQMSQPINEMQVGKYLTEKLVPPTAGDNPAALNYSTFARAMQNPDVVAQRATGFAGSKLANALSPEAQKTVSGVSQDVNKIAEYLKRGSGTGSATARRLAQGDILAQNFAQNAPITAKVLEVVGKLPPVSLAGKGISTVGGIVTDRVKGQILDKMDDMLANNPQQVAKLIEQELSRVSPTQRQQIINALPRSIAIGFAANGSQ